MTYSSTKKSSGRFPKASAIFARYAVVSDLSAEVFSHRDTCCVVAPIFVANADCVNPADSLCSLIFVNLNFFISIFLLDSKKEYHVKK